MTTQPVALVSGVSSGIGRAIASLLAQHGFRVIGTARRPDPTKAIVNVETVSLDVRDAESVRTAVGSIARHTGRIDVLVNNAGYALIGAVEETTVDEAKAQFDTNFFGVVRVIQAVLPFMRKARAGRIINLSSVLGFLPAPYMGFYAASKHALEGYSESLDHEVRTLGIRTVLIEPSFTRTRLATNGEEAGAQYEVYRSQRSQVAQRIHERIAHGADPESVAAVVLQAVEAPDPRLRYTVGREAALLSRLRKLVPGRLFDRSLRKDFRLDPAP